MAVAHVQDNQAAPASSTTHAIAYSVDVTSGNLLVIGITTTGADRNVTSVTDSLGNTGWTVAVSAVGALVDIWYTHSSATGPNTVTATTDGAAIAAHLGVWEASGVRTASPVDATGTNSTSGVTSHPCSEPDATTTFADDYGVALSGVTDGFDHLTQSSNWTLSGETVRGVFQHQVFAATATIDATWTSSVNETTVSALATFKGIDAGAAGMTRRWRAGLMGAGRF